MKKKAKKRPEYVKVPRERIEKWVSMTDSMARKAESAVASATEVSQSLSWMFLALQPLLDAPAPKQLVRRKAPRGRRGKKAT